MRIKVKVHRRNHLTLHPKRAWESWMSQSEGLLIFDVLQGQTTDKVLKFLENNNILATKVPPNATHLFQPLDLTVNEVAKDFTEKKFSEWFSRQISIGLENGQELEDIEIDYRFSVLKPLHATWLISFYDYISSPDGKAVVASGWKKIGYFRRSWAGTK